jgi:transcriptional regulator with XRE-family HTH domain
MIRPTDTEDHLNAFSEMLRGIRAETGKSLKELERLTATSDSSLSRYLSGSICPPWSVVEMLCGAAQRDPAALREPWERAHRQRSALRPPPEAAGRTPSGDPEPVSSPRRAVRRPLLAIGIAVLATLGVAALLIVRPWVTPAVAHKVCPWQYIVTDGDPAPVIVFDQPGADRQRTGWYEPSQIFYAPEPPQAQDGRMRTQDGWINQGDWIRRYPDRCRDQR